MFTLQMGWKLWYMFYDTALWVMCVSVWLSHRLHSMQNRMRM